MVTISYDYYAFVSTDCAHHTDPSILIHRDANRCVCSYAIQGNWIGEEVWFTDINVRVACL